MSKKPSKPLSDDFNTKQEFQRLSEDIYQSEKFAEHICKAAKSQVSVKSVFQEVLKELLKNDQEARHIVKGLIREVEKEDLRLWVKKIGFGMWTLFIAIASSIATYLFK